MKEYQQRLIALYVGTVLIGSLVQSFIPLPDSILSNKHNALNRLFVKVGWVGVSWLMIVYSRGMGGNSLASFYAVGCKTLGTIESFVSNRPLVGRNGLLVRAHAEGVWAFSFR
jgi:hypothetical protein